MTPAPQSPAEAAAAWFARLQEDAPVEDWQAFTTWLEADPANQAAYNAVEAAWIEVEDFPEALNLPAAIPLPSIRRAPARRGFWIGGALAAAAAVAVAVVVVRQPAGEQLAGSFKTDATSTRVVKLGDGTQVSLNRSTELSVALQSGRRDVILTSGEASFDVASDHSRPFHVTAGGHDIRVTGTEFNVVEHDKHLTVTVRRGSVVVEDLTTRAVNTLEAGTQLSLAEGGAAGTVEQVDAADAFAWQDGNLIYKNAPLTAVAADLSRYFGHPVKVTDSAASIQVSAVLQIDAEPAMLRRLAQFAPISVQFSGDDVILTAR
ncbi:Protein FecR [Alphaproteobacteria bacterium SO-S41]|nr:Protein FecR [Alphaproteobacteria bacterium SO-S41]